MPSTEAPIPNAPDLPEGWQDAERVPDFVQMPCPGTALVGAVPAAESLEALAGDGGLTITYDHAQFRCEQPVEGFARRATGTLDVLVQPVDMNPSQASKCVCQYYVTMTVNGSAGRVALTLYRRWDNLGSARPTEPVRVAGTTLEVP